jgi:Transposase DNA-binding/Transposase Tn5 dimerisation domain/Transposase DDE domain
MLASLASWEFDELRTADLKDKRLDQRFWLLLDQLGAHPTASIPAACGGWAETAAAYRFFDNDNVDLDSVLKPHLDATRIRISAQPVVLVITDTTELDLTRPHEQVEGTGPLDGNSRRGVFLHITHAFAPDGTPLGTIEAITWARADDKPPNATKTRAERAAEPIEDKESHRWLDSLRLARAEASRHPGTRLVWLADSEADIYEVIAEASAEPQVIDFVVRACQDRALVDATGAEASNSVDHLRNEVLKTPVLYTQDIKVRGREPKVASDDRRRRQPRQSRTAQVEVRATQVTLRAPWRSDRKLPDVTVNAVLVTEVNPPDGDVPVEWLLLTSLPIDTLDGVHLIVQYYCTRWMVEIFFRVLKSGCRVEERRFKHIDNFLPCLGIYMIVGWRVLMVCRLGRSCPEISCEAIFTPTEWKSVYQVVRRQSPPPQPPRLQEMVRMVAQLGGYINRKRQDEPGPQTVWLGMQRMHDIALCWELFGPGCRETESLSGVDGLGGWDAEHPP